MKLKHLESAIQSICPVTDFGGRATIELEQYSTPPRLAASFLLEIQELIEDKVAIDLGCGCGVLSAGLGVLGASLIYCFDIDAKCLGITEGQLAENDIQAEYICCDIESMQARDWADIVVTNPPFGTRKAGIDWTFVKKGICMAPDVFSFHKSSTRGFFQKKCEEGGIQGEVLMSVPFTLPKLYKVHTKKKVDVEVDIWHFSRQ